MFLLGLYVALFFYLNAIVFLIGILSAEPIIKQNASDSESVGWKALDFVVNEKLYGISWDGGEILVTDVQTYEFISISMKNIPKPWGWGKCILLNNKIYCMPYNARVILVIDTLTDTVETLPVEGLGNLRFLGAVSFKGNIYGIEHNTEGILDMGDCRQNVLMLNTQTLVATVQVFGPFGGKCPSRSLYLNVKAGQNGKIRGVVSTAGGAIWYGIPSDAPFVYMYLPSIKSVQAWPFMSLGYDAGAGWNGENVSPLHRFNDGVLVRGKIYMIPFNADFVLIVHLVNSGRVTFEKPKTLSGLSKTEAKWSGAVLDPIDEKLYCIPFMYKKILVINTKDNTMFEIPSSMIGKQSFIGAAYWSNKLNQHKRTIFSLSYKLFVLELGATLSPTVNALIVSPTG